VARIASPPASPSDNVHVQFLGREREPLVVVDDITGQIEELVRIGRPLPFEPVAGYPGIRSRINTFLVGNA
jgi:hypothetical protein